MHQEPNPNKSIGLAAALNKTKFKSPSLQKPKTGAPKIQFHSKAGPPADVPGRRKLCVGANAPRRADHGHIFLALNWFGDSLDGTLARLRNRQRPRYGFYVDHMIDTFGGFLLMGGLAISGFVDWRIALGMFVAFLMLSVEVYLAAYAVGTFRLSFAKFGPTEIRILLAFGNVVLWFHPKSGILGSSYRIFDVGGIIAIAGMALMLVVAAIINTIKLYRAETLR
jgi:phosphatidylglycerophosphate synthase